MSDPITWTGKHEFLISGTERHEDTLRVRCRDQKQEWPLRLHLPTLCITYADMKFANAIGGRQEAYPDSTRYGPAFFDPPVEINGRQEVERLTWIRGAERVVIGRDETVVEFRAFRDLVVPRLRIRPDTPAAARLAAHNVLVRADREFAVDVSQLADGRPLGGISVRKRHPDYRPPDDRERPWSLWIKVIDGITGRPIPKARLRWLRWPESGSEAPAEVDAPYTDEHGVYAAAGQPPGHKEALSLDAPGWRALPRCLRPLPGQPVHMVMRAWPLRRATVRLADGTRLTCFHATYRMEPGDTFDWVAKTFGFRGAADLAEANGVRDLAVVSGDIALPGWYYLHAGAGDRLAGFDKRFGLRRGSARTVGRVHHPDPGAALPGEVIALPLGTRRNA